MRLQAQLALEELNENMKNFVFPKPQLNAEKKIVMLNQYLYKINENYFALVEYYSIMHQLKYRVFGHIDTKLKVVKVQPKK